MIRLKALLAMMLVACAVEALGEKANVEWFRFRISSFSLDS